MGRNTKSLESEKYQFDYRKVIQLSYNISGTHASQARYRTTLNESSRMINQDNMKIDCGCKYNNLYPLMSINPEGTMNIAKSIDVNIWHGQLGHMPLVRPDRLMVIDSSQSSS